MSNKRRTTRRPVIPGVLILEVQALAQELKRTPTCKDLEAARRKAKCHSMDAFLRIFGSWSNALRAAKLPLNEKQEFSREHLLDQLRDLGKSLGGVVRKRDVTAASRAGNCARPVTFRRGFGTLRRALEEAEVLFHQKASRRLLVDHLRNLAKEIGRPPSRVDVDRAHRSGKGPSYAGYWREFRGMIGARKAAGFAQKLERPRQYSREQILTQLRSLAEELGRTPTLADIYAACSKGKCASPKIFIEYFGSYNAAVQVIGLKLNRPSRYRRGQLIAQLQDLTRKLGKLPSNKDLRRASKEGLCASARTFENYFGTVTAARDAARCDLVLERMGESIS
jgi:hypothetical protein